MWLRCHSSLLQRCEAPSAPGHMTHPNMLGMINEIPPCGSPSSSFRSASLQPRFSYAVNRCSADVLGKKKTSETHPQSLVPSPSRADEPVRRAGVLLMRHQHALPRCRCLCSITLNLRNKMGSFLEILNHAESVEHKVAQPACAHTLQDTIVDF